MHPQGHHSGQNLSDWELLWRIGQGSQAVVYRAQHTDGRNAAIKLAIDAAQQERIREEGRTLSALSHPGLPTYIEEVPGGFAMELVQGTHLGGAKLPIDKAAALVAQVADTVGYLHEQGVAHRDLKPENILVNAQGQARLIDLGGVGPAQGQGASMHTPGFAPPEPSPRGLDMDRFALGRILESLVEAPSAEISALISELTHHDPSLRPEASVVRARLAPIASQAGPMIAATLAEAAAQTRLTAGPFGRYELKRLRGRGAMGEVWQAWDTVLRREVALKVTRGDPARFAREARAIAQLGHPNLVRLLDFGADQGRLYMAMDLVDGPSLQALLEQGPPPEAKLLHIAAEVAAGLSAVHAAGLLHRDLKPANVLLSDAGAKLADFGLVSSASGTHLTHEGTRLGTPAFMAPEQARAEALTPAADVYGLGAVLFRAMTGAPPHVGPDAVQTLALVAQGGAPKLNQGSAGLQRIVNRCLQDHAQDRYPDAQALLTDLERLRAGEDIARGSLRPWLRQHGPTAGVALGLLALVLGLGGMSKVRAEKAQQALAQQVASLEERVQSRWLEDPDGAREMLAQGLQDPSLQQTQAAADAWLRQAERESGEARLDALANAYFQAPDPRDALSRLAGATAAAGDNDSALAAGWILSGMGPQGPTQTRQASAALLALGRIDQAQAPLDSILSALSSTTALPMAPEEWVFTGGGWVASPAGVQSLRVVDAEVLLGPVQSTASSKMMTLLPKVIAGDLERGPPTLLTPQGETLVTLHGDVADSLTYADIDGDEIPEYVAAGNDATGIVAWSWGDEAPRNLSEGVPGQHRDLVVLDMDGDGNVELARPSGAWGPMDVRIYQGGASGQLPLRTRLPLGHITRMEGLADAQGDWLLISKTLLFGSRLVFPSGNPEGLARGVHIFTLEAGRLTQAHEILDQRGCLEIHSGDVDGDGVQEAFAICGGDLLILARRQGAWHSTRLKGITDLQPLHDLDGDGEDELVVRIDGAWQVLGSGAVPLRILPPPASTQVDDPKVKRAVEMAEIGLYEQALMRLELLENDPVKGPLAAFHRGRILVSLSRSSQAEASWALAASDPAMRPEVERMAAMAAWADGRSADALRHLEALLQTTPSDQAELLALQERWARSQTQVLELSFTEGLPEGVQLLYPAEWSEQGLRIRGSHSTPLIALQLSGLDGPVRIELDLVLERMEWSGGVDLRLVQDGESVGSMAVRAIGGSGMVSTEMYCTVLEPGPSHRMNQPEASLALHSMMGLRLMDGESACGFSALGISEVPRGLNLQGNATLKISLIGTPGLSTQATLKGLRIYGAELGLSEPTPYARAFALGQPAPADSSDESALYLRVLDLERRGESESAEALVLALDALPPWFVDLLHNDGARWLPVLAQMHPDPLDFYANTFAGVIVHHSPDPQVDAMLIRDLPQLQVLEHPDAELLAFLLRHRGAALRRAGQTSSAKAHLERAWALEQHDMVTARELAILHLNAHDTEEAMRWALAAMGESWSSIRADHLDAHPGLLALHGHPEWARISAARLVDGPLPR